MPRELQERLFEKVLPDPNSGCWLWSGAISDKGYGTFHYQKKTVLSHRLSYILSKGDIPENAELDHLCRIRCCVNPQHLEAVSTSVNQLRGANCNKDFCSQGHPYKENRRYKASGRSYCKECNKAYCKAAYHAGR